MTENLGHFRYKVIILDIDYIAVLETAPPSVLKLPADGPVTKVQKLPLGIYRP
jgi:hypothetical protein